MTLGASAPPESRKGLWLMLGLLALVLVGGGAGSLYFLKGRGPASTLPTTLSPEAVAAQARVRELEARIAQLEREKVAAETAAAEEARRKVEAQAGGRPVDPAAMQRAQEEARRRARAEQEQRQQEELALLATEKKTEERRLAEASPPPTPEAVPAAAPIPTPTTTPTPTPTPTPTATPTPATEAPPAAGPPAGGTPATVPPPATSVTPAVAAPTTAAPPLAPPATPAVRRGTLVEANDPAVTLPVLLRQPPVAYPEIARQARVEGVVEIRALVDENGNVINVSLVRTTRPGYRFEAEAERHIRGRKYRPATKGGVAVRIWMPIVVNFKAAQ